MDKRKIRNILLVIISIIVFVLSYYVCINRLRSSNIKNNEHLVNSKSREESGVLTVDSNIDTAVSANANLVFKMQYNKSGDMVVEKEKAAGDLVGKKKNELEEIFKDEGYKVKSITPEQVVLVKEVDKYSPNKYVLGIKDGCIAIFKTDKDGNMFIENEKRDITDIKIEKLKQADIDLLTKGDKYFQCNSREDAEARLEDYE